jgi:hypothetical protein
MKTRVEFDPYLRRILIEFASKFNGFCHRRDPLNYSLESTEEFRPRDGSARVILEQMVTAVGQKMRLCHFATHWLRAEIRGEGAESDH